MKKIAWLMLLCSVVLIIPAMAFGETVVTHLLISAMDKTTTTG